MSKDYFERIMANTQAAADQWNKFAAECGDVEAFKKAFHLRPKSDEVTVVSTLKDKPMRGVSKDEKKVEQFLRELYDEELHLTSDGDPNKGKKIDLLTNKGFKDSNKSQEIIKEEFYQANMISLMSGNSALKSFLKVENLIFIASEFILHPKSDQEKNLEGLKVDIVGYDGLGKIFFFELKTPENKEGNHVEQVSKYLNRYSEERKEQTIAVLSNYPISSIKTSDVEFHGYVVYGYSDNLDTANSKLFKGIEEPGLIYFK